MSIPQHLKPIEWRDLEVKDTGPRGIMNVVGYYQSEQSLATTLGMAGDRDSERCKLARSNMETAADYLATMHHIGGTKLDDLVAEFTEIAAQRSRSQQLRRTGIPAVTSRND